jgi:hypothetical protein
MSLDDKSQKLSALLAVLRNAQRSKNVTIGDYHHWTGEPGYIFRRKKKSKQ